MTFIAGCDPGQSGGIAILTLDGNIVVDLSKMPETPKDLVDYFKRAQWLTTDGLVVDGNICMAGLERVHAMPGQGVTAMFTFGFNLGLLHMALVANNVPMMLISPTVWQKTFGLLRSSKEETKTDKKNRHKAVAQELFPGTKITHHLADALLIAEHLRRTIR